MSENNTLQAQPLSPEEEQLAEWITEQHLKSPDHLEAMARHIISLVTGLIGLLLGILSLNKEPLPAYMHMSGIRPLAVLSLVLLLLALLCSLFVIRPRRWDVSSHRLDAQRAFLETLVQYKSRWLNAALICFFLGVLGLASILILAIAYPQG